MRVFITGASGGLGEALAREYARRHPGVELGLVARRAGALAALQAELEAGGRARVTLLVADVNDRDALWRAAARFAAGGPVDVVVANAGISAGTVTGEAADAAVFARILQTNAVALFDTFTPFVPAMKARGSGTLVGIASVAGIRGLPGAGGYSASKAAAIAYLESLRVELAGSGLKVVTIAPGYVRTAMTAKNPYPMPFLLDADEFARRALKVIDRGGRFAVIPWQMGVVATVLKWLPRPLYDLAFRRAPRKPRVAEARGADAPTGPSTSGVSTHAVPGPGASAVAAGAAGALAVGVVRPAGGGDGPAVSSPGGKGMAAHGDDGDGGDGGGGGDGD